MGKHRYPGTASFSIEDSAVFSGREEEIKRLSNLVLKNKNTLLFGKSGLGKTSLLNAGIIPDLLKKNISDNNIIQFRFRNFNSKDFKSPIETFEEKINFKIPAKNSSPLSNLTTTEPTLWLILKKLIKNLKVNSDNPIILIFDQFEELDTYPEYFFNKFISQLSKIHFNDFKEEVESILNVSYVLNEQLQAEFENNKLDLFLFSDFDIRILFSIRKDRLDFIKKIQPYFPSILNENNSYELKPLNRANASKAIIEPAKSTAIGFAVEPFKYDDEVVNEIINSLSLDNQKEEIESFQLQIICKHIENLVIESKESNVQLTKILTSNFLKNNRGFEEEVKIILKNHYEKELEKFKNKDEKQIVRRLIEEKLISESENRRLSRDEEVITTFLYNKLSKLHKSQNEEQVKLRASELLQILDDTRIIRAEANTTKGLNYEISHDTLLEPILRSKKNRKSSEAYANTQIKKAYQHEKLGFEYLRNLKQKKAQQEFEKAFDLLKEFPKELGGQLKIKITLGKVCIGNGDFDASEKNLKEAFELSKNKNLPNLQGKIFEGLGSMQRAKFQKHREEIKLLEQTVINYEKAKDKYHEAENYINEARLFEYLGYLKEEQNELVQAKVFYHEARKILNHAGEVYGIDKLISSLEEKILNQGLRDKLLEPWGYLKNLLNNKIYILDKNHPIEIGRNTVNITSNHISFSSNLISRKHLRINNFDKSIEDQRSLNGSTINAEVLPYGQTYNLKDKDIITLANLIPLQFLQMEPKDNYFPSEYWNILICDSKFKYFYFENEYYYLSVDQNNELIIETNENENTILKITSNKFFLKEGEWDLICSLKKDDYKYERLLLRKNEWLKFSAIPLQLVKRIKGSFSGDIIYGPSLQFLSNSYQK